LVGKVKTVTLERAAQVLQKIEEVLDSSPTRRDKLINLSNQVGWREAAQRSFYTSKT
jgi:hypothetical protein